MSEQPLLAQIQSSCACLQAQTEILCMLIIFLYLRPNNVSHKMPTLTYHGYAVLMLWQIAFGGVFCSVDRVSHHVKTMCADFVLLCWCSSTSMSPMLTPSSGARRMSRCFSAEVTTSQLFVSLSAWFWLHKGPWSTDVSKVQITQHLKSSGLQQKHICMLSTR